MNIEEALALLDKILITEKMSNVQELVFRQCWQDKSYQEIAENSDYAFDYIRVIGSQLWHKLSEALGEKVTKSNFRSVLRQNISELRVDKSSIIELPCGLVPIESKFYVERPPTEERSYQEVLKPGALIRIKAPKQWGKTSLMMRVLHYAACKDYQVVRLNFQQIDLGILTDLDRLLRWFCASITRQLGLVSAINNFWDEDLGSKVSCTNYLQEYILEKIDSPLILGLDEVDRIFEYPKIASEFLPLLRFWHEEGNNLTIWQQLRIIVVYSTENYVPLNINQSPFNVGLSIELREFNLEQMFDLARRYKLNGNDNNIEARSLDNLRKMINGHPYLVSLAFYHLFRHQINLEHLLKEAITDTGIYRDHLRGILATLQQYPELGAAFKKAVVCDSLVKINSISAYKLESMALVKLVGDRVRPSCELYRLYFRERFDQF